MSKVSESALYRNPTGVTCGLPSTPTVAIRHKRWLFRKANSFGVKMLTFLSSLLLDILFIPLVAHDPNLVGWLSNCLKNNLDLRGTDNFLEFKTNKARLVPTKHQ
jgi:hypothetical protein